MTNLPPYVTTGPSNIQKVLVFVGVLFVSVIALRSLTTGSSLPESVAVVGTATAIYPIQSARVTYSTSRKSTDRQQLTSLNQQENAVLASQFAGLGISPAVTAYPQITSSITEPGLFELRQAGEVTIDPSQLSQVQNLLQQYGGTIAQVVYVPIDAETVQKQLIEQAVAAALVKANQVAHANGKKVGSVISVNEMTTNTNQSPILISNRVVADPAGSGQMMTEVTQSLSVTYYLEAWWRIW